MSTTTLKPTSTRRLPPGPNRTGQVMKQKWRIDELLGAGGMAAVYAATHRNGNRVAIKILHPQYVADQSLRKRFQREGYVANLIEHAAVVRVLDDDVTEDGSAFLVMELLEGETLASRLQRESVLATEDALIVAYQVLDVLAAAHPKGIVHRDIKPDNIFLTSEWPDQGAGLRHRAPGRICPTAAGSTRPARGRLLGTPAYMAPEQALQKPNDVDGQTDVWAVGATLFRMLTGRPPREGTTFSQQLLAAASQPVPRLHTLLPQAPSALCETVDRATAFHRIDRWPSAAVMQAAIRPQLRVVPTQAPAAGPLVITQPQPTPRFTTPVDLAQGHAYQHAPEARPGSQYRGHGHAGGPGGYGNYGGHPGQGQAASYHTPHTTHSSAHAMPMGELRTRGTEAARSPRPTSGFFLLGAVVLTAAGGGWLWAGGKLPLSWMSPTSVSGRAGPPAVVRPVTISPDRVPPPPRVPPRQAVVRHLPRSLPERASAEAGEGGEATRAPGNSPRKAVKKPGGKPVKPASRPPAAGQLMDDDELLGRRH